MKQLKGIQSLPKDAVYDEMDSPVGLLTIITSAAGLHAILWDNDRRSPQCEGVISRLIKDNHEKTMVNAKKQLTDYFQKQRTAFDLPLVLNGTDFQLKAWEQLLRTPYASTLSYAEQAERLGNKNKARAVGMANSLNPISIVVPCHRVIDSNGSLVGFGGGILKKSSLLSLEKSEFYI